MIPYVTISVLRPESRITGRLWRRVLLVCSAVVVSIYWILYEHLHTNIPQHTLPTKSSLTDLHPFTPHPDFNTTTGVQSTTESGSTRLNDIKLGVVNKRKTSVAIGMGISLKGIHAKHPSVHQYLQTLPVFSQLLPSFCRTASLGYRYDFYLAHDKDDSFFTKTDKAKMWNQTFANISQKHCKRLGDVGLNLVRCNHSGRPAWAQNDAMMAAHKDGCDFFYRVNDDSIMITSDWTSVFIKTLQKMKPPLVGVVGPKHSGGNTGILTYDFVHRTHINIFGYYYPRAFPWWYADDWITMVYQPGRSTKLHNVHLQHTMSVGTRYINRPKTRDFIIGVINSTKREKLERYLREMQPPQKTTVAPLPNRHVKTPNFDVDLPLSTLPSHSLRTITPSVSIGVPISPLPPRNVEASRSTIALSVPPPPSTSGKTPKSTINLNSTIGNLPDSLVPPLSDHSGNIFTPSRGSTAPTQPSKGGKHSDLTLSLSSKSGNTSDSTIELTVPLSIPKSQNTVNSTLGSGAPLLSTKIKQTSNDILGPTPFYPLSRDHKTGIKFEPSKARKTPGIIPSFHRHTRKPS